MKGNQTQIHMYCGTERGTRRSTTQIAPVRLGLLACVTPPAALTPVIPPNPPSGPPAEPSLPSLLPLSSSAVGSWERWESLNFRR